MEKVLSALLEQSRSLNTIYKPLFFHLKDKEQRKDFTTLLEKPGIMVFDQILGQVEELIKCYNPKRVFKAEGLKHDAIQFLNNQPWEEFGVWVYYPWSNRVVHILDEKEFIEVRTNRNQYKITPSEKEILSKKKVGVVGLSIGQSIALTLAMERVFGELRIADFDVLELSNYNRIRTGLHNLGSSKVIAVAREIAEIDPFLKVTCFTDGLNEENMEKYFLEGGKLDLLVEACDGLDIKILSRRKAKELRIPVVMDTSDRGMIDIERFDLDPNRPILHGLIDHLDTTKLKGLTNEEKVPFLLPMIGAETMSDRLKASMLEIEQSITTWPQLASAVTLGGGATTDVCRRILLDQLEDSGRYYIDVENIIFDKKPKNKVEEIPLEIRPSLTFNQMKVIAQKANYKTYNEQVDLEEAVLKEIVTAAGMAPSGANIQPWRWIYLNKNLFLFFDDVYSAGLLDCQNTISFASLGAAVENLVLKTHELNFEVSIETTDIQKNTTLVAVFRFFHNANLKELPFEPHILDELSKQIPHRLTNRNIRNRIKIDSVKLNLIKETAKSLPNTDFLLVTDEKIMDELAEVTAKMDRIRVMHEGGHKDFRAEIRWTPDEAKKMANGVDLMGTVDLTPTELAGWQMAKRWPVIKLLNDWGVGSGLEKIQRKSVKGSSALGLLVVPEFSCHHFFLAGRAMERLWLKATELGLSVHPASLSTLIFNTYSHSGDNIFSEKMLKEVGELKKDFLKLFSVKDNNEMVLLFRFFISEPPKARSVRYPIEKILFIDKPSI